MFADKLLNCRDCGTLFPFTAGEQSFFSERGLTNEPRRCANCRLLSRLRRNGADIGTVHETNCAECQAPVIVPFQPRGHKPIYCSQCMRAKANEHSIKSLAI